nr:hypothetical protein [Methylobacterium sp. P1-11]
MKRAGRSVIQQNGREAVTQSGDLVVVDRQPLVEMTETDGRWILDVPRERLERVLGLARLYTALTVGADLASASLATTFFTELMTVRDRLGANAVAHDGNRHRSDRRRARRADGPEGAPIDPRQRRGSARQGVCRGQPE